ncbi:MAG: DNA-directed RNA polymerase subunit D [Candidatus Odinarchaeota archaeon]
MRIEILEQKGNFLKLGLLDSTPAFANSLRRTIISEVPTLAIEEVILLENTSPLYDEIIAHRLGLIPLKTDLETYNFRDKCTCEGQGCSACEVSLMLDKDGEKGIEVVYSRDLIPDDPKVIPVIPDVPVLKMTKGQKVSIQCLARLGKGKDHARWQPVSTVSYKYKPVIKIDNSKCTPDAAEEITRQCPKKVFTAKGGKLKVVKEEACTLCNVCVDINPNVVAVTPSEKDFIFFVESTGSLEPVTIVREALKVLKEKATEMNQKIEEVVYETV